MTGASLCRERRHLSPGIRERRPDRSERSTRRRDRTEPEPLSFTIEQRTLFEDAHQWGVATGGTRLSMAVPGRRAGHHGDGGAGPGRRSAHDGAGRRDLSGGLRDQGSEDRRGAGQGLRAGYDRGPARDDRGGRARPRTSRSPTTPRRSTARAWWSIPGSSTCTRRSASAPGSSGRRPGKGRPVDLAEAPLVSTPPDNRKGLTPEFEVAGALELTDALAEPRRRLGFTDLLSAPAGAIATGQSALVSLSGLPRREAIVAAPVALHVHLAPPIGAGRRRRRPRTAGAASPVRLPARAVAGAAGRQDGPARILIPAC